MFSDQERERRFAELTLRRVEILGLIEQQFSQAQFAERIHIQPSTVHSHVHDLEVLYGCDNMGELARRWAEDKEPWVEYVARLANVRRAQ